MWYSRLASLARSIVPASLTHYSSKTGVWGLISAIDLSWSRHPVDTRASHANASFLRQLHRALRYLYDPVELGKSPLIDLLGVGEREDPPSALRRLLSESIEALKPEASVPPQASAWRTYQILSQRYSEQFTQREVASTLALSTRQLARLEAQALRTLADHLWNHHAVTARAQGTSLASAPLAVQGICGASIAEQELQWLRASYPSEPADAAGMVQAVLKVGLPLAQALGVRVECQVPEGLPLLAVQLTTMRQALLNILTAAIRCARSGGRVAIDADATPPQIWIDIRPTLKQRAPLDPPATDYSDGLEIARQLIALSGGTLEVQPGRSIQEPFYARILLPVAQQLTVLVIDDNVDTLQLLERYLVGSRYRFVGTPEPQQALALAEETSPQVIVLDVMLPGIDGWEVLGRLREHPRTRRIPVVICTILPQDDLAQILGAAALVRKPVTQLAFLAALDQVLGPPARESG